MTCMECNGGKENAKDVKDLEERRLEAIEKLKKADLALLTSMPSQ